MVKNDKPKKEKKEPEPMTFRTIGEALEKGLEPEKRLIPNKRIKRKRAKVRKNNLIQLS